MKRRQLERNLRRPTKRLLTMNKQSDLSQQKAFNQNQQRQKKSQYSLSCASYLKEYNLSKQDLRELRQALQQISHYFHPRKSFDHQQRLTSPYLQQQRPLFVDDQSSSPLYTNEYFIRNGLLNHNDGPEIYDEIFSSRNRCHRPIPSYSPSSPSSMNISLPLVLLPNQKHLFTALTSNFASNQPRCSRSSMALTASKYDANVADHQRESESMNIRRNKVQIWERDNVLQRKMSVDYDPMNTSEYHRSSLIRTMPSKNNRNTMIIADAQTPENNECSLQPSNRREKSRDNLFPMVKKLGKKFLYQKISLFLVD